MQTRVEAQLTKEARHSTRSDYARRWRRGLAYAGWLAAGQLLKRTFRRRPMRRLSAVKSGNRLHVSPICQVMQRLPTRM